ncbi:MAG: ectoine/hydroxyectoine ABC transporter permease subunit EhuD, partial [Rhizobiaceae bacterium]|nr:ectoine/hydroxyectoine ABC transporter permease subunit EhuD [Rhizobiaceae bacterium]
MDWSWLVVQDVMPKMLAGLVITIQATFGGAILAYALGLLLAILKMSKNKPLAFSVYWSSEFVRRTP